MLIEEWLERERQMSETKGKAAGKAEGKAESIICILSSKASISEELANHIMNETNLQTLDDWLQLAVSTDSIEQFMDKIHFTI